MLCMNPSRCLNAVPEPTRLYTTPYIYRLVSASQGGERIGSSDTRPGRQRPADERDKSHSTFVEPLAGWPRLSTWSSTATIPGPASLAALLVARHGEGTLLHVGFPERYAVSRGQSLKGIPTLGSPPARNSILKGLSTARSREPASSNTIRAEGAFPSPRRGGVAELVCRQVRTLVVQCTQQGFESPGMTGW